MPNTILISLALMISGTTPQDPLDKLARIEGKVVDGTTERALRDVVLTVVSQSGRRQTMSDGDGHFVLDRVTPGRTTLLGVKPGYMGLRLDNQKLPGGGHGIPVNLQMGEHRTDLLIRLFPAAIVSGTVSDALGQPLGGVIVTPFRFAYDIRGMRSQKYFDSVATDDRGQFRLATLDPGYYGFKFDMPTLRLGAKGLFYPLFYPAADRRENSDLIKVEAGKETRLPVAVLVAASAAELRLQLVRENQPVGGRPVVSVRRIADSSYIRRGPLPDDGVVGTLSPGSYDITVVTNFPGAGTYAIHTQIEMGAVDMNVRIALPNPGRIIGRVVFEGREDLSLAPTQVQLTNQDSLPASGPFDAHAARLTTTQFAIPSLAPGLWSVDVVGLPPELYLIGIDVGGQDLTQGRVALREGETAAMTVRVGVGSATVRGTVVDTSGQRVLGAVVVLISDDTKAKPFYSTRVDEVGMFELRCPPGQYRLYAWTELEGAEYANTEFLQMYADEATPLSLEKESTVTVVKNVSD